MRAAVALGGGGVEGGRKPSCTYIVVEGDGLWPVVCGAFCGGSFVLVSLIATRLPTVVAWLSCCICPLRVLVLLFCDFVHVDSDAIFVLF